MKMREELVYKFYKDLYPNTLVLFRMKGKYVALLDDAKAISDVLTDECCITEFGASFPDNVPSYIARLGAAGRTLQIVSYRNSKGELDFPNIEQISLDKEEDY